MPKTAYVIAVALALVGLSVSPAATQAQSRRAFVDPYLAAKITLGLGGSVTASSDTNGGEVSQEDDLSVSFGLGAQYLFPLHDYFSLGGLLQFQSWRSTSDGGGGRNLVFDLAVLPQAKYVVLPGQLELNFGVPIGIALDFLNEIDVTSGLVRFASGASAGGRVEGNTAVGFVIGALLGARYQLTDSLGALLELGYLYRTVGHTITTSGGVGNVVIAADRDVNISWGQFQLNLGVYF